MVLVLLNMTHCCRAPLVVPFSAVAVHIMGDRMPAASHASVLNGALVALCVDEHNETNFVPVVRPLSVRACVFEKHCA